ncbi:MAG: peptidase S15 [Candidatus Xenobia bacterium]
MVRHLLVLAALLSLAAGYPARYEFTVERGWMTMPDGVRLSVTWFRPQPLEPGERFPVLLEMLPYRKDDMFYQRDYPLHAYFARRGYATLKVDIRGTGSSEGVLPPCEYSEQEIKDALTVIDQASRLSWTNGRVGMFGISWGGFNAIQVAMRNPPALKAILPVHASDDLYQDDVHYLDGVLHYDQYHMEINRDNALPDSLEYRIDEAYFRDRFDREPWFFTYLRHQQDGPFWRQRSQRFRPGALKVPVYAIGGLQDFYRDTPLRLLQSAPLVKVEVGNWGHDWPDTGTPGPNYEWRQRALEWWDFWLKDRGPGLQAEKPLLVYQRGAGWRLEEWPVRGTRLTRLYPLRNRLEARPADGPELSLQYAPGRGVQAGVWWDDATEDVSADAEGALVFDSAPVTEPVGIVGLPRVHLRARSSAPLAHWSVRLEDVAPDGKVQLVTGAVLNGSQRASRTSPSPLPLDELVDLPLELHFTTWTFQPGHRIRLSVSNAQFQMVWPSPHKMTTHLKPGERTWLELPVVPAIGQAPELPAPEPRETRPDAESLASRGMPFRYERKPGLVIWEGEDAFRIQDRTFRVHEKLTHRVDSAQPANASMHAESSVTIELPGRILALQTLMRVQSDADHFHAFYRRVLSENGRKVRERNFEESFVRRLQ